VFRVVVSDRVDYIDHTGSEGCLGDDKCRMSSRQGETLPADPDDDSADDEPCLPRGWAQTCSAADRLSTHDQRTAGMAYVELSAVCTSYPCFSCQCSVSAISARLV